MRAVVIVCPQANHNFQLIKIIDVFTTQTVKHISRRPADIFVLTIFAIQSIRLPYGFFPFQLDYDFAACSIFDSPTVHMPYTGFGLVRCHRAASVCQTLTGIVFKYNRMLVFFVCH